MAERPGFEDVYLASLAGYHKLDEFQTISASIRYFSLGTIQFTDATGNDLNTGRPREMSMDLGYARKLSDRLALGISIRYIYSNLASGASGSGASYKAGNAAAGDIGLYYNKVNEAGQGWHMGAAFTNLGTKTGYSTDATQKNFIPTNFGICAGHTWVTNEVHKISLSGEVNKMLVPAVPVSGDSSTYAKYNSSGVVDGWAKSFGSHAMACAVGAEYLYNDQFALRAGYYRDSRSMGKRSYFTIGAGLQYNIFGLNFSYLVASGNGVNRKPLSNTIRFGLNFRLAGSDKEGGNAKMSP